MKPKVFISKNEGEVQSLINQLPDFEFITHSFLEFTPNSFQAPEDYDAVFFGSPRAVTFFLRETSIQSNVGIGCVGKKTAQILIDLGYHVSFVLDKSGEIEQSKKKFTNWVSDKKIVFPISNRSLKSFSSLIPEIQKEEIVVYNTDSRCISIEHCDYYVFSSPSNVEAYFDCNEIPSSSQIIAWGESTQKSLEEHQLEVQYTLSTSSLAELIKVLSNR